MTSLFVFSAGAPCAGTPLCAGPLLALPHGFGQASSLISIKNRHASQINMLPGALFTSDVLPNLALCRV